MDKKRLIIILSIAGIAALLVIVTSVTLISKYLREREARPSVEVVNVTACDADASGLCVVSFGVDNVNRQVINFQLPSTDLGPFYVKARYEETTLVYPCQAVEGVPTSVYCTGERTPLGLPIEIQVYATEGDVLIARGILLVSAVALPTMPLYTRTPTPTSTLTPGTPSPAVGTPTILAPIMGTPNGYPN
ncbi:MAG: hypothetical protein ACOY0R_20240 [Chloroflexota bacterium]|jgi:hypothetical protein